jgi:predicted CXXCH cytochrome family protein
MTFCHTTRAIRRSGWGLVLLLLAACEGRDAPTPKAPAPTPQPAASAPEYVTSAECRGCHAAEFEAWSGSHHDRAMQTATGQTVLGDFDDTEYTHAGQRWAFFRRDAGFGVRTEGPDGAPAEFEVRYTFGVEPLQQYLVSLPGGRMQALTVAWDTRPAADGGQRWFSLYPDEDTPAGDILHWTGAANRWNSMCADCHSTNLRKSFDLEQNRYETRWSELDVACEACHGPGSLHVAWAEAGADATAGNGLSGDLLAERDARWVMDPTRGIAHREPARLEHRELDTCAPCHSRRSQLREEATGKRYLDHYRPALLEAGLYFADGQIQDEVYVYGSFLQSKMYRAGVSCGDCHEPHSLKLRAPGDDLCARCHAPERFAVPEHHHHELDSEGARCVGCHMPSRTYMVIDDRHDHSFRVPRPDLTHELGSPDACSGCHADRDASWAAQEVAGWGAKLAPASAARALALGRTGAPDAADALRELARSESEPAIARASAIQLLARFPSTASTEAIARAARDRDPLVRAAAARAAESLPPTERLARIGVLLEDPLRSVRIEAARTLASAEPLPVPFQSQRSRALAEYRSVQRLHADDPSAHVNLGLLALAEDRPRDAERHYERALEAGAYFIPTYVNLADLYRRQGRDPEGEALLRQASLREPESAELQHALGLALVRLGETGKALDALAQAAQLAPESARYAYVYGVAQNSLGQPDRALATLEAAHQQHPTDVAIVEALAAIHRDEGHTQQAQRYAEALQALGASPPPAPPTRP